jgi:twitching motility protein PilT
MTRLTPDPDLNQLVRELNEGDRPRDTTVDRPREKTDPQGLVPEGNPLERLLNELAQRSASDLFLVAGAPPIMRVAGRLNKIDGGALSADEVHEALMPFLSARVRQTLEDEGAADFSIRLSGMPGDEDRRTWRFRVNVHRQRGTLAAAIRALPSEIPTLAQLNLPPALGELVKTTRGLLIVCGPAGSGKSTTLAALVGEINRGDSRHVITIEDPIEYEHRNARSIIEQVEVGRDSPSFAAALRASLRQNPDVILVGEMRDLETVATALTAAETGHLILSTLHTSDAVQAVHRILDVFPPNQQTQVRHQLAVTLHAVISQVLIPRPNADGRSVAVEVLLANQAVRNHIRNDKLQNLASEITLGKRQGMISLEDSLVQLVQKGLITVEDARLRALRPDELESLLRTSS